MSGLSVDIVKKRLVEVVRRSVSLDSVVEWLWEDYGVRVRDWDRAVRVMLGDRVTLGDLIAFLDENGVEVDLGELESV
ncbi:MAG: hypothetical protein LM578_03870 [Desulfurococcaceae archaeon]|nr:hypothetical protein [Desulfurococcaceae archaeon]